MATIPTFDTWAAGEFPTAAKMTSNIQTPGNFFLNPPMVAAYQTATQSLVTGTLTTLTFDTEYFDTDGMHSIVTNTDRITIVTPGTYMLIAGVGFAANATGVRFSALLRNGGQTYVVRHNAASASNHGQQISGIFANCIAGDYFQTQAQQTSGGNLATVAGTGTTFLQAIWMGN